MIEGYYTHSDDPRMSFHFVEAGPGMYPNCQFLAGNGWCGSECGLW